MERYTVSGCLSFGCVVVVVFPPVRAFRMLRFPPFASHLVRAGLLRRSAAAPRATSTRPAIALITTAHSPKQNSSHESYPLAPSTLSPPHPPPQIRSAPPHLPSAMSTSTTTPASSSKPAVTPASKAPAVPASAVATRLRYYDDDDTDEKMLAADTKRKANWKSNPMVPIGQATLHRQQRSGARTNTDSASRRILTAALPVRALLLCISRCLRQCGCSRRSVLLRPPRRRLQRQPDHDASTCGCTGGMRRGSRRIRSVPRTFQSAPHSSMHTNAGAKGIARDGFGS